MSRIAISRCGVCLSEIMRSLPQRSQVIRRNHDEKVLNGSSRASAPVGNGSVPSQCQCLCRACAYRLRHPSVLTMEAAEPRD